LVYKEIPIKIDDLGVPILGNPYIYNCAVICSSKLYIYIYMQYIFCKHISMGCGSKLLRSTLTSCKLQDVESENP
jgi:hypothetical protein